MEPNHSAAPGERYHKTALVIGGGIAGVQASLDLAQSGVEVFLLERGPSIGGRMAQLDKTFPTNDCAMCILSPKLVEVGSHPNIHLLTHAELLGLDGEAPRFTARIRKHPRYVDEQKCTGCGVCTTKCPVKVPDPYNLGLSKTRCLRIPFPQAVPALPILDPLTCIYFQRGKCRACEKLCQVQAIDFNQQPVDLELEVGAVIAAPGSSEFQARLKDEYGYGTFPNVVTSLELERMLSASGPWGGHVQRPSDGQEPSRVAFLQCVGSRDKQVGHEHCSSICCMQAAKDAIILAEHLPDVRSAIFFMDLRAYGKGFDRFVERARDEHGVRLIRARVSSVEGDPETEELWLQYPGEDGRIQREAFDLAVLSVGLCSGPDIERLLQRLGLRSGRHGFLEIPSLRPLETSRRGVFACGTLTGPKDIPESVVEASGAAAAALANLAELPAWRVTRTLPAERDVSAEPPRVGVFVCHCGINIASTVDVEAVVAHARELPRVVHADHRLFACSADAQKSLAEAIREHDLNRVVVAACTPRTHEPLFQKTLEESGLNRYLFEFANIREQCAWVHQKQPREATEKAKALVRIAVARAVRLRPLEKAKLTVCKTALVLGGGVAGMTAALDLDAQGFPVHLVERESELGGRARDLSHTLEGEPVGPFLDGIRAQIASRRGIQVHLGRRLERIDGYVGNFRSRLVPGEDGPAELVHGVVVVATGAEEYAGREYLRGQDPRVVTQLELEGMLERGDPAVKRARTVAMIQCVGSRDAEHPNCSRVCCSAAIKNASRLRRQNPRAQVIVLYRDIRAYGLKELFYQQAREQGVLFVRYEPEAKPEVRLEGTVLRLGLRDAVLSTRLELQPDLLVLSTGIAPRAENRLLSQLLKVPLDADGFFLEAHVKLRPVDFATDGVFVCGTAHGPKDLGESIAQARAAAARASTVLSRDEIEADGKVAEVVELRCSGCGACVEVCAYRAVTLDAERGTARVQAALCKGCGTCAATCRAGAIDLSGFTDTQILAGLEAM